MTGKDIVTFNIQKQMRLKNLSPKKISDALSIPYTTVLEWTKGIKTPRIDKLEILADFFGVSISDLLLDPDDDIRITKKELDLIRDYRLLDETSKNLIHRVISGYKDGIRVSDYKKIIDRLQNKINNLETNANKPSAVKYDFANSIGNYSMVAEEKASYGCSEE